MPGCSKIYLDVACLQMLPCQKEPRCKWVGKWKAEDQDPGTKMETSPSLCFHKCKHLFRVPEPSTAEQRTQQPKESSILDTKKKTCIQLPGGGDCPWPGPLFLFQCRPRCLRFVQKASPSKHPGLFFHLSFSIVTAHAAVTPWQPWPRQSRGSSQQVLHHEWEMMGQRGRARNWAGCR